MKKVYIEPLTESITIHTGMTVLTGSVYEVEVKDDPRVGLSVTILNRYHSEEEPEGSEPDES